MAITTKVVLGYTAVHVVGVVLFGLAACGLFALAERETRVLALFCFHRRLLRELPTSAE